ncbi:penicillin acylase family protein [Granulicella sibirica]|uniref:Penicillin acylase (Penicillin amidase) n=1 Tax=Granulicella sibirica TaxID=2479048 RepID=A0A4Q0T2B6_9BACT|nr:penicillin acylase family protein [Granulicella sibirica]RXH56059.1 Penicillin acylase (Penicillin amidase) [Granulicella sibirica]
MSYLDPLAPEPLLATRRNAEPPPARKPRRLVRAAALILPILLLLALAASFGARYWVRNALQASLPQLDGQLSISGLSAPVSVRRDAHGVPHIQAANVDDLILAQGYVTAQDRLWQMDTLRRSAAGDLAEILGASLVSHDRTQRLLQMRASADSAVTVLPPDQLHWLEQYAKGVNASMATQAPNLPLEFRILRYKPAPWTPRDSILIGLFMFQDLSTSFPEKLGHEALAAKLSPDLLADLYPAGSWRDHPPGHTVDLSMPVDEIEQIPLDESQSKLQNPSLATPGHAASLLAGIANLPNSHLNCDSCIAGSNNWAVSADHSTTGKPILSNDTHLRHSAPGIWYEADLEAPTSDPARPFHAAGVTIPGAPFVIIGHNAHVAWGLTVLGGDVQDLYIEHLRGQGSQTEYQSPDGSWRPVTHREELIHVHGSKDVILDVQLTHHGEIDTPIISGMFPNEQRTLALRWIVYDPTIPTSPFFDIDSANDWPTFSAALSKFNGPSQNLMYADDQGHIAYHAIGRVPLRGSDPTSPQPISPVPTDATAPDAATHEWSGYIPFDKMPAVLDPPDGILATANARTTPDNYPYPINLDWAAPYRNERIWKLLASKPRFTVADMLAIQTDVYSDVDKVIAERLTYALDHAIDQSRPAKPSGGSSARRLHQAADLLRTWNGHVDADSPAAAIVDAARAALWTLILTPRLGPDTDLYLWGEKPYAEEQIIMHTPDRWLPPGFNNWDQLLTAAVDVGLNEQHAPLDLSKWSSGKANPVEIDHPIYSRSSLLRSLLRVPIGTGIQPQSGDGTTVKQVGRTFGPSQRLTVDLSNLDESTLNIVLGQSGDPASPWFMDQFNSWLHGTTYPMPFTTSATTAATSHTLTLNPQ